MNLIKAACLLVLMLTLCSWGEKGHLKINSSATPFLPPRLRSEQLSAILAAHGSDADNRKRTDTTEIIKHYIDIDNYPDFVEKQAIAESWQAALQQYGLEFIKKNGTLPWVTDSTYHALVEQFRAGDWERAMLTAADLGHYVGDGHMPLHLTANYDGQFSDQKGIHSRYESRMINMYVDSIAIRVSDLQRIKEVNRYIFGYIYRNYPYKDSLLVADKLAYEKAGRQYNEVYYRNLWELTRSWTQKLMEESSKSLAELIRMAWMEAGRPRPNR